MGVAMLEGSELVHWGVCGFRQTEERALFAAVRSRVRDLLALYQPAVVVMETPSEARIAASPMLAGVVASLRCAAAEAGLSVKRLSPEGVAMRLCGSGRATHAEVVEQVVRQFEHLERFQAKRGSWKEAYWQAMFAAVALALACAGGRFISSEAAIPPR